MNILIIEDEEPAAERLKKMVQEIEPDATLFGPVDSVQSSVKWLKEHTAPDLIFMDINLADGSSFEIFRQTNLLSPVIFTTAYDEYAILAFKFNSIDYLLKPIKKEELVNAVNKYKLTLSRYSSSQQNLKEILANLRQKTEYKKRFIIRFGDHIKAVETSNIAYFYTEEKINFLRTKDNHTYHLDLNLDKLESLLDPGQFFRINRQVIISLESIDQMFSFSKSRVKVMLKPPADMDTIVSTDRSPKFKEWLGGEKD